MLSLWKSLTGQRSGTEEELLGTIPLFEDLTPREIDTVQRLLHRREYVAGEAIFTQGEPGLGMYIIMRGVVSIQREPTGRELTTLTDGDFFGEIALLNEVIRTATARAKTDCLLLSLFQPDLLSLLDRSPRLGVKVLLALARLAGMRLAEVTLEIDALSRQRDELLAERDALRAALGAAPPADASGDGPPPADA